MGKNLTADMHQKYVFLMEAILLQMSLKVVLKTYESLFPKHRIARHF